ncbi:protein of unknown function [Kyrpidia spormannii]|uniref:Uncharacterized protein n=1 Tax=Kyrpidia spormannii TaxID=2055160 RepID=A0A6F9DZI8_9BACL|nr:protein of unknown function [Kyrpidia spormannii]
MFHEQPSFPLLTVWTEGKNGRANRPGGGGICSLNQGLNARFCVRQAGGRAAKDHRPLHGVPRL